jgi:PglZ domain-containing protein
MTILSELRAEVQAVWQRSPTQTVLWLDPQHEWERLLDQLAAELELVKYAGSQLELRVKIELEPAQQPRIVYVPLPRQALSVLKEYEFTLPVWDESLLHALRRWGVGIERDEEKSLLPLLPGLAARWSDRPKDDWRHLTASGVRARLFDDEPVRDFLADPAGVADELERDGALAVFGDFLEEAFGVPPAPGLTPQDMARQLVQNLILTEATQYSSGGTFPYQGRLPGPGVRERCLRFLARWLEARTQAQTAARLLRAAEQDIPLGPWAATLESIPDIQSSLQVERALVQRVLTDLRTRSALDERAVLLHDLLPVFRRHAAYFWAVEGEVPEWEALSLAGAVVASAWAALAELPDLRTAAEIVQAYVDRWWRVDRAYQRYRAGFEEHGGLDDVADTVRKLHRRYLEETNKRFAEALAAEAGLEATGLPPQRSFWPASAGGSRAVLVLDAFRFDLARELEEKLRGTGGQVTVELHAMRAPLPSITPLGMASLLPLETLQVDVSDGTWAIRPGGADAPDLATKAGREQWLASLLDGYKSIELGKLLDLPVRQVPRATWLFVYSTTLDEAGHGGVISLTPHTAEEYVEQCARGIRKLASAGIEHIHVVTDHGFFLLDEVADHDLIPVTAQDVHYKSHRAIVGRDIASPGLLTFPLVGSDLTVGVPRATDILAARGGYQFFHGGASLQEIVVPHLYATLPRRVVKFDVRLHAPSRITSLLFDVVLEAVPPGGQYSFSGQVSTRYVEVRAYLVHDGQVASTPLATAAGPEYFVSEAQMQQRVRLRISDTARFRYGDTVRIVALDADAPEVQLDQADATLHVEPDV